MTLIKKNLVLISLFITLIQSLISFSTVYANDNYSVNDIQMPIEKEERLNDIEMPKVREVVKEVSAPLTDEEIEMLILMGVVIPNINTSNTGLVIHNPNQVIGIRK